MGSVLRAIDRRAFLVGIVLSAHAAPRYALAQADKRIARIGFLSSASGALPDSWWDAFLAGLRERGWTEGQNLVVERRYAELKREAARAAAEELLRLKVDVIVVANTLSALAAKQSTSTIPIVMTVPADPVATGLVQSLSRPGGNVTGLSFVGTELAGKQVELLKEAVPGLARITVLANPNNASHQPRSREIADVAKALKLQSDVLRAGTAAEIRGAFATMAKRRSGAVIVLGDPLFVVEADNVLRLAAEHRLPAMYGLKEVVLAGGLMAYGANFADLFRRAATYVDKILRGARPADLPVEQASTFELVINLKTAKALGLAIPQSLLARADEIIR
jgi:putative tryptophan/tyrosine transport system substrate-binding protein